MKLGRSGSRCVQYPGTMIPRKRSRYATALSYDPTVLTYPSFGGQGKGLIVAADLVLRTEMFRINTLQPTQSGDGIMASVLTSKAVAARRTQRKTYAAHIPTHDALVEAGRRYNAPATVPKSVATSVTPRGRVGSSGEVCRLFATGSCKWGDACKRVSDTRARNPPPGLQRRMDTDRGPRRRVAARWSKPL